MGQLSLAHAGRPAERYGFKSEGLVPRAGRVYHVGVAASVVSGRPDSIPSFWRQALVILEKDLRIEARTGEVTLVSAFFAVLVVVLGSLLHQGGSSSRPVAAAGTLWLTLAFSAILALSRSWHGEREDGAFDALLATPVARSALFLGKCLGLVVFLIIVEGVVFPLTALLYGLDLLKVAGPLVILVVLATLGIAAAGTLFGAMTVRTRVRDMVLAIVLFPLLLPSLLTAAVATRELLAGTELAGLSDYLLLLGSFDVLYVTAGLGLFGTLVDE